MIRARIGGLLLLWLDAENVKRLQAGKPIHVFQAEVDNGEPITGVGIVYGNTLADIVADLKRDGLLPADFQPPKPTKGTQQ